MALDPVTISLLTGAASKGFGSLFGGGAQGPAFPFGVYTPQMAQQTDRFIRNRNQIANMQRGTPVGVAGTSLSYAQEIDPKTVKRQEYVNYLVGKGYTPENAMRKAAEGGLNKDKGFREYAKTSDKLKVKGRKIKGTTQFTPGGVQVDPMSTAMRQGMYGLGMESLGAAQGLPSMFAGEAARALATRQGLANQALGYLGLPIGQDGLSERGERNLDALNNKYLNDFSGLMEDTSRNIVSQLAETGFSSSNLAKDQLKSYAGDVQSDFLVDALAKLAGQEEAMLTGRQARETQTLNNMLNAFGQLGATGGIGSVTGGILNPAAAGLFTDPTAAQMAQSIMGSGLDEAFRRDQLRATNLMKSVTPVPDAPGFFSNAFTGLAPALGLGAYMGVDAWNNRDKGKSV